jgi:hypothetical protein
MNRCVMKMLTGFNRLRAVLQDCVTRVWSQNVISRCYLSRKSTDRPRQRKHQVRLNGHNRDTDLVRQYMATTGPHWLRGHLSLVFNEYRQQLSPTGVRFPTGTGISFLHHLVQTGYVAHNVSYPKSTRFSSGVRRSGHESVHSPPYRAEFNVWNFTSIFPYVFMA